jgi:hypothetical protein
MKKKICGAVIMAAIALVSGWNISRSTSETTLSDVAIANVEALAQEIYVGHPCAHVCCGWCMYFWDDGTVDDYPGIIYA